jgi:shikimate kinase
MLKNINKLIKNEHNLITLIGMMGTGKTKFGNLVAHKLDYSFYDSDVLIEKKFSLTIRDIFTIHGEIFFRKVEKEQIWNAIEQSKKKNEKAIISIGGGGFDNPDTRSLLLKYTKVIWLNTSISTLIKRVGDASKRPMIQGDIKASLNKILKKRTKHYLLAHYKLDTDTLSTKQIIDKIIEISAQ